MNDEIRSMLKDAGIIVAITLIAGLVLGGVYQLTKEPIAEQKRLKKQKACQEVYEEAVSFAEAEGFDTEAAASVLAAEYPSQDIDEVMLAQDGAGNTLGYVLTVTTHEGYGGDIHSVFKDAEKERLKNPGRAKPFKRAGRRGDQEAAHLPHYPYGKK